MYISFCLLTTIMDTMVLYRKAQRNLLRTYWGIKNYLPQNFPGGSGGKASASNVGDRGSIPGLTRSPGEGNDNPLQYSCLENPIDRGAWWATVHGIAKSRTRLSEFTFFLSPKHIAPFFWGSCLACHSVVQLSMYKLDNCSLEYITNKAAGDLSTKPSSFLLSFYGCVCIRVSIICVSVCMCVCSVS